MELAVAEESGARDLQVKAVEVKPVQAAQMLLPVQRRQPIEAVAEAALELLQQVALVDRDLWSFLTIFFLQSLSIPIPLHQVHRIQQRLPKLF
jgi:hypothetical protein